MSLKILRLPIYITIPDEEKFQNIKTGFGYSAWDISRYSAYRGNKEYCVPLMNNNREKEIIEGVNILPVKFFTLLRSSDPQLWWESFKYGKKICDFKDTIFGKMYSLFFGLYRGYFKNVINKINPDIVHIHSLSFINIPQIDAALRSDKPFVLTLHALRIPGVNDDFSTSDAERKMNMKIMEYLNKNGVRISVVSSQMKENLCAYANIENQDLIEVIPHGVDLSRFSIDQSKESLRKKYNIDKNKTVFLSAGSLQKRKNYSMAIKAIDKLPSDLKNEILYLIAGKGNEKENLQKLIQKRGLKDQVELLGYVPADKIEEYFNLADGVILCSKSEGCSRPMLEAYGSGTPVIIFGDLEGTADLYDPNCMQLIKNRSVEDFSEAISKFMDKEWNEKIIRNFAKDNISWHNSLEKYEKLYEKAIKSDSKIKDGVSLVQRIIEEDI